MIKSVNDTNVWLSGINWDTGAGYLIRRHWEAGHFRHFISGEILYEIIRVLREVFEYPDEALYDWYWLLLKGSVYEDKHLRHLETGESLFSVDQKLLPLDHNPAAYADCGPL
jgi:hypothetical protein